ncbi:MAG: GNAT family N-acetyltransferase [Anaerolineae bacterium]|jgi:RimJ/RimL family protein N-acetyltransferase
MSSYTIRPYTSEDNAPLAVMWNDSDDQWPGTFTGGVPMTEEQVRDWMDEEICLMRLVVENSAGGSIVGYGSLWETPGRKDSCYVALLNVHPDHQKRSLARRMLTQMIDWATEHGYRRVTIGTWPANLKSVPLYKKVGFHWVPDLDVFMENYIPAVRRLGFGQDFFQQHDWYTTFQRELKQVADEQRHPATGDMKVFVFRWEDDGEAIEAVVDRYAQAITGVDTADFAAYAIVDESEPAQGIAYPVRWRVTNKRDEPVNVSVLADGETGIGLNHQTSFALAAGETQTAEATFVCAADAPKLKVDKHNRDKTAPKIKTTVVVGDSVVELGTGLHYRPAVDIGIEPEFPSLLPGETKMVHLTLRNRAGRSLKGSVSIEPQDALKTDWLRHDFEIEAGRHAGLPLEVTCERAGAVPLRVTATFEDDGRQITAEPKRLSLLATPVGGVAADWNEDEEMIVVENDFFRLVCQADGGKCLVRNKAFRRGEMTVREEIGPPFTPRDLGERTYDLALERGQGWAKVILTAKSGRFSGVSVAREVTVTASPLMQVRHRVVNNGGAARTLQVRPVVSFSDQDREGGMVALPRQERLVITRGSDFPMVHGDLPQKPEKLSEQWVAFDRGGQVGGAVWNEDVVKHEMWWGNLALFHTERALEPQSAIDVGPLYVYVGPGGWRDVRRVWQRVSGVSQPDDVFAPLPASDDAHAFGLLPAPLVTLSGEVEARLGVANIRERELNGRLVIEPPAGWTVDRTALAVEGVTSEKSLTETLRLTAADDRAGAYGGRLLLESEMLDEARPFTVLRLGDGSAQVVIKERREADQAVWDVDSGRCVWTVAPEFDAGVIAWREVDGLQKPKASAKEEAQLLPNHLMTSFPDDGGLSWMKPWFGGVRPIFVLRGQGREWPGWLHAETFSVSQIEAADAAGVPWQGVRLAGDLTREGCEDLRAELDYLTVGGSNVLKVVFRMLNRSSAPRGVGPGFIVFVQVDGDHQNGALYGDDFQRKRSPHEAWTRLGDWGAIVNPDTGRALAMVSGSGKGILGLTDWGKDGGHFWFDDDLTIAPHGTCELVAYLALAESLEEARRYESMKQLTMNNETMKQ